MISVIKAPHKSFRGHFLHRFHKKSASNAQRETPTFEDFAQRSILIGCAPDQNDVDWAKRFHAAAGATSRCVFTVDGQMVDAPIIVRAKGILQIADEE